MSHQYGSPPTSSKKFDSRKKSSKELSVLVENVNTNYNHQQQYGRLNGARQEMTSKGAGSLYPALSPTAWMFDFTGKKISQLCRPFMSGNSNIRMSREDSFASGNEVDNNSVSTAASWRNRATQIILGDQSDDGSDNDSDITESKRKPNRLSRSDQLLSPQMTTGESGTSEARIIAPNVDKLSPISVVEIRLQSVDECVAILCSVDVLKMRSIFYREVLLEQEENRLNEKHKQNDTWRPPLLIPEVSPFEAAAFIESLHEGRHILSKGMWNYTWARLSVSWQVEHLVLEYASQIEAHIGKILLCVQNNNWRTNPNILQGVRVAVLKKSLGSCPTIITGVAEIYLPIGYSKIRVAYDSTLFNVNGDKSLRNDSTLFNVSGDKSLRLDSTLFNVNGDKSLRVDTSISSVKKGAMTPQRASNLNVHVARTDHIHAEVGEPFWIEQMSPTSEQKVLSPSHIRHVNGLSLSSVTWCEPDEAFLTDIKKLITDSDKRIFWEMAKAIMELPMLIQNSRSTILNSRDLAVLLKRTEYKCLWTLDAPHILPKDAAIELISAAYVINN